MVTWASAKLSQQSVGVRIAAAQCLAFLRELQLSVREPRGWHVDGGGGERGGGGAGDREARGNRGE